MTKYVEFTGKTEALALEAALAALGLERDDVTMEILERPKSGFLGIGASPAKIRVGYEAPDEPEEAPAAPEEEKPQRVEYHAPAPAAETAPDAPAPAPAPRREERPAPKPVLEPEPSHPVDDEASQAIVAFLTGLLEHMDVEAELAVSLTERGSYEVQITGPDLGGLIGRRGDTLDAIQQLTGYAVNRGRSNRIRVHLDAEGYRARREESLANMARKTAERAIRLRRSITLEPMNAYERHVVHTALQGYPHISTHSTGVEPNRRTVICYEDEGAAEE